MAVHEVLSAVAEQWADVHPLLTPASRDTLQELVRQLDSTDDDQRARSIETRMASVVLDGLPTSHPIAALGGDRLSSNKGARSLSLASTLLATLVDRTRLTANERILGEPWDTAVELRNRG